MSRLTVPDAVTGAQDTSAVAELATLADGGLADRPGPAMIPGTRDNK
ncbi:MAG: hypothetical protein WA317_22135 [Mycobacterium sp.]